MDVSYYIILILVSSTIVCSWVHGWQSMGLPDAPGRSRCSSNPGFIAGFARGCSHPITSDLNRESRKPRPAYGGLWELPMAGTPRLDGRRGVGPLKALNPDTVYTANEWIAGVAGGSVGVLGTLIQLELKQERVKSRRNCPYCDGSGKLICAQCCCSGKFVGKLPGADLPTILPCPGCGGEKYIECLNCRGDGRAVPRELDRKTAAAAEVDLRLEEIGMANYR